MIKMRNYLWRMRLKPVYRISVIDWDGSVGDIEEERGITASQLMQRYPQRIVSHANSFYIGQKVPVLSSGEKLEGGQSYFLLPEKMGGTILSAAWLASLAAPVSPLHGTARCCVISMETFEIEKREDGRLQLKILPEFIQKLLEYGKMNTQCSSKDGCLGHSGLCSTPQLQKDYEQMVRGRARAWKPRLETIVEKGNGFKLFSLKRKSRAGLHKQ